MVVILIDLVIVGIISFNEMGSSNCIPITTTVLTSIGLMLITNFTQFVQVSDIPYFTFFIISTSKYCSAIKSKIEVKNFAMPSWYIFYVR